MGEFDFLSTDKDLKTETGFANYLENVREQHRFYPRPDLKQDHYIWAKLLRIAYELDHKGYVLLHGFRCGGCRLQLKKAKIKLDLANSLQLLKGYPGYMYQHKRKKQTSLFKDNIIKTYGSQERKTQSPSKKTALKQKALNKIKKTYLQPNLPHLKLIFREMNHLVKGISYKIQGLTIYKLNNLLAEKEKDRQKKIKP